MKTKISFLFTALLFFLFTGCERQEAEEILSPPPSGNNTLPGSEVPEGYFEVNFFPSPYNLQTRAPITGHDARVQHVRYIIYKATGEYVKEKVILSSPSRTTWPLANVRDTLPKGEYRVVFIGNVEKTLFPYATSGSQQNYADVLTDYQTTYDNARIILPAVEFSNNTEYYWANTTFSDASPAPAILLQRIIGSVELKRVLVDGEAALNMLVNNIVTQIGYRNIIQTTVEGILPELVENAISSILGGVTILDLTGFVDDLTNPLLEELVDPVVDALYNQLLEGLVAQLANTLTGNTNRDGLIDYLDEILNPWNNATAGNTVVSINNYPRSIDFNLEVKETFTGVNSFMYGFNTNDTQQERFINLKNFNLTYDIRRIDVVGSGLIGGVVVDQAIDEFLLDGPFVDINDPILVTGDKTNWRYGASYSLAALYLTDYTQQNDGEHGLDLSVRLGDIANLDDIVSDNLLGSLNDIVDILPFPLDQLLQGILNSLLTNLTLSVLDITVSVPVNLPLLGIDNLEVSGSWSPITRY